MESLLHKILLSTPVNLFDSFMEECQKWYDQPAHTFTEMRTRDNKKIRGDIFEDFTVLYLRHARGYKNVWRLQDVPKEVMEQLGLQRQDMGIDIVAQTETGFSAVQCKYKKHRSIKRNILTWKQLSTFYALCMRTGPWEKYIVVTNCDYARHMGKKSKKDLSICMKTLRKITKEQWTKMCQLEGSTTAANSTIGAGSGPAPAATAKPMTIEELRAARLARFTQVKTTNN